MFRGQKGTGPRHPLLAANILSDTQGVDFGPYMGQALTMIKKSWVSSLSKEVAQANNSQTETVIRFTISQDGTVSEMTLVEASHHIEIERAAWGSVVDVGKPIPACGFQRVQTNSQHPLQSKRAATVDALKPFSIDAVWGLQCSLGARSVGPQRILRSAPRKTARIYCALVTATGMTVAVWTAGTLRAYCCRLYRLRTSSEKDDTAHLRLD
jgi:hypothetical protein